MKRIALLAISVSFIIALLTGTRLTHLKDLSTAIIDRSFPVEYTVSYTDPVSQSTVLVKNVPVTFQNRTVKLHPLSAQLVSLDQVVLSQPNHAMQAKNSMRSFLLTLLLSAFLLIPSAVLFVFGLCLLSAVQRKTKLQRRKRSAKAKPILLNSRLAA